MSQLSERAAEQTAIRHKLLTNGYTPLANDDKRCMLKGWPRLVVTPALIEEWAGKLRYQATGVRLDGALTVIDIDIDDADIIDDIIDALPEALWDRLGVAPERRGKGAKLAWFVRCDEPFQRFASLAFVPEGEDPEAEGAELQRVEVFGPRAVRQFGAFGAHTIEQNRVKVAYRWTDRSLLDVPLNELPLLTLDEIDTLCRIANDVMQARGWVRHARSKSGKGSSGVVYDLTDDMKFVTRDYGTVTLTELEELAQGETGIRLSASWLEGDAVRNTTRCIAGVDRDGRLQIYETASGDLHKRPVSQLQPSGTAVRDALSRYSGGSLFGSKDKAAPSASGGDDEENEVFDGDDMRFLVQDTLDYLLQNYAFCPTEDKPVYPIYDGGPRSMGNFKNQFAKFIAEAKGPRGGTRKVHPVDLWTTDPSRIEIVGERFNPRTKERIIDAGKGWVALNQYRPPEHGTKADAAHIKLWHAFLEHLLPHEDERAWFRMWLAAKVQSPWQPNCAVLMFTETQGTGRGTLFDILRGVMGHDLCSSVGSLQLLGDGGQAQYNEWLAGKLLVICEELMQGDEVGLNQSWRRKQAYERLKTLFDPRPRRTQIVRKGRSNYDDAVHASFLLASNHPNALPIPSEDRRLAVLRNTEVKLEYTPIKANLDRVRVRGTDTFSDSFITAVYHDLMSVAVDEETVFNAPSWLVGRQNMIDANKTDVDYLIEDVVAQIPGDYITWDDLRNRARVTAEAAGLSGEPWQRELRSRMSGSNTLGWRRLRERALVQPKELGDKRALVFYRVSGAGAEAWDNTPLSERPALLRRGSDLNDKLSRAGQALRDGRFSVIETQIEDEGGE